MIDVNQTTSAPDFTATDSEGRTVQLSAYQGKKNILLVFNRGFWCPHCRRHMAQLHQDYQKFVERNTEVITIGPGRCQSIYNLVARPSNAIYWNT